MALPKWMLEDLKISDAETAALEAVLTPERIKTLEDGHLRQSDYSRNMDQLKKDQLALTSAQTELGTANERLNGEIAVWAETQAKGGELTAKQQKALETAEANQLRLTQLVRSLATAAGQDPEKALEGITVTPPARVDDKTTVPAGFDPNEYLPRDAGARLATLSLALATTVPALVHEHFTLTGETLDTEAIGKEIIARIQTAGNKKSTDVREVWMELHGIGDKRTAAAQKKQDDLIAAAEARGRTAALSEVNLPGPHAHIPGRPQSTVMKSFTGPEHKSAINRPAPGGTVSAAVSAFRSGKYRPAAPVPAGK